MAIDNSQNAQWGWDKPAPFGEREPLRRSPGRITSVSDR